MLGDDAVWGLLAAVARGPARLVLEVGLPVLAVVGERFMVRGTMPSRMAMNDGQLAIGGVLTMLAVPHRRTLLHVFLVTELVTLDNVLRWPST
jgi:hypothetical protein